MTSWLWWTPGHHFQPKTVAHDVIVSSPKSHIQGRVSIQVPLLTSNIELFESLDASKEQDSLEGNSSAPYIGMCCSILRVSKLELCINKSHFFLS